MKVASAAYSLDFLTSWAQYEDKLDAWMAEAAGQGAELLVFPEYASMELSTLAGRNVAMDLEQSLHAVADRLEPSDALHAKLAKSHGVHVLAGSSPAFPAAKSDGDRPVNRARLFAPNGQVGVQDKQIMTRFEAETWDVVPGGPLSLFDTALGKIGILICYDSEFPLLGRALSDADIIIVPSLTEKLSGYSRVRIGAQARALENQCVTIMSSIVGETDWSESVDMGTGAGGIFGPPDRGFPETGVLGLGELNAAGWTYADIDPSAIAEVRADGRVLNRLHWDLQDGRSASAPVTDLK